MDHRSAIETISAERYILNEMPPAEREDFEAHFFECAECAEQIRALMSLRANLRAEWEEEAKPLPAQAEGVPFWERCFGWLRPAVAAPALAVLLTVVGYQNLVQIRETRAMGEPRAAAQLLLRGETRGEGNVARLQSGESLVLTLDLAGTHKSSSYRVRLESDQTGRPVEWQAAPNQDGLLTAVLPDSSVGPGHYTLRLDDAGDGTERARYQFEVRR